MFVSIVSNNFVQLLKNLIIANFRDEGEEGGCSSRRKRIGGEFAKMPLSSLFSLIIYFNSAWFLSTGFALCDQWQIVEVVITQGYRLVSLVIAKQRPLHRVSDVFDRKKLRRRLEPGLSSAAKSTGCWSTLDPCISRWTNKTISKTIPNYAQIYKCF